MHVRLIDPDRERQKSCHAIRSGQEKFVFDLHIGNASLSRIEKLISKVRFLLDEIGDLVYPALVGHLFQFFLKHMNRPSIRVMSNSKIEWLVRMRIQRLRESRAHI